MPILKIEITKKISQKHHTELNPAARFAKLVQIAENMVTIYTSEMLDSFGNQYQAIAHLYLPDLWSSKKSKRCRRLRRS